MRKTSTLPVTTHEPEWITLKKAAELLEVSENQTHNMISNGRFKGKIGYYYAGRNVKYLYCKQDLEAVKGELDREAQNLSYSQCAA